MKNQSLKKVSNPLVSIIMPAYNAAKYIEEAIASVQMQDYLLWELIIIDDGSTDDTLKLAVQMAKTDNRIKVLPMVHKGSPSIARNAGLENANGEMITFLDADDRYETGALTAMLNAFDKDSITAVYGFSNTIDAEGKLQQPLVELEQLNDLEYDFPKDFSQTWEDIALGKIQCLLSALMIKKSTLKRVGLLDERWVAAEDYQFFARLFMDDFDGVKAIPAYLYQYRIYGNSLTKTKEKAKRILEDNIEITDWVYQQSALPESVRHLKSETLTEAYRYLSRERLLNGQADLALWMVSHAYNNSEVKKSDWMKFLLPMAIRAVLGCRLNAWMVQVKCQLRNNSGNSFPLVKESV